MIFTDDEIKLKKAICPYCGARLDIEKIDKITVCEYCDGKIFADGFEMPVKNIEEDTTPDPEYKKKFKKWLLYVTISMVIFYIVTFVLFSIMDLCFGIENLLIITMAIVILFLTLFPFILISKMPVTKRQKNPKKAFYELIHREKKIVYDKEELDIWLKETKEIRSALFIIMFINIVVMALAIYFSVFK